MAFINAKDVNHIRVALKKEFPQYKFSVTRDHWLGVNINFMKGPRLQRLNLEIDILTKSRLIILMVITKSIIIGLRIFMVKKMQKS